MSFIVARNFFSSEHHSVFTVHDVSVYLERGKEGFVFGCSMGEVTFVGKSISEDHVDCKDTVEEYFRMKTVEKLVIFNETSDEIGFVSLDCSLSSEWILGQNQQDGSLFLSSDYVAIGIDDWTQETVYSHCNSITYFDSNLFRTIAVEIDVCQSMEDAVMKSGPNQLPPFIMISDDPLTRYSASWNGIADDAAGFPWSLSYWLSYCGLTPTTVHTWQILPSDHTYCSNCNDICNVKYVLNKDYNSENTQHRVTCLEDVLNDGGTSLHNVFVSSLGLPFLLSNFQWDEKERMITLQRLNRLYFLELVTVIRAYHSWKATGRNLYIRSLTKPNSAEADKFPQGETELSTVDLLLEALTIESVDINAAEKWNSTLRLIHYVLGNAKHSVSSVMDAIKAIFLDDNGAVANLCDSETWYWCVSEEHPIELLHSLQLKDTASTYFEDILKRQDRHSIDFLTVSIEDQRNVSRPIIQKFLDGECYVLIYVLPSQWETANEFVLRLRADANKLQTTEAGIIRYLLFPMSVTHQSFAGDHCSASNRNKPSRRAVIDNASQFISDVVTVLDLVVILNGLDALLSFQQPLSHEGSFFNIREELPDRYTGILPRCKNNNGMVEYCSYSLEAPIIVACSNCRNNTKRKLFCSYLSIRGLSMSRDLLEF